MGGDGMSSMIMLGLMVLVFWFFMIRPQMKKQKELKKFREALAKGDHIVTIGGIHGKILEVADSTVLVQSEGTKIRLDKSAISQSSEDQLMTK
ncbi:MAG: preprotein translocase subunit YajC [Flavobacteriales bacterium]|jgi:preprotein translocase subunit YajC|nr:preprotein translocase subunit YajC [Flavobacteriales bacterium]MDA7762056.1 preprotein translocase subunit YajC [Crocinitomicaceae bacterium]MDC0302322.1 preprotein translocase subunit YajC [bacterium]